MPTSGGDAFSLPRRLEQLEDAGEVELTSFTEAELAAVTMDTRTALRRMPAASTPKARPSDLRGLVARGFVEQGDPLAVPGVDDDRQAVALLGDLAVVVSLRTNPTWVAEVSQARRAGPKELAWSLYGGAQPPAVLDEHLSVGLCRFWLRRPDRAVQALLIACGLVGGDALDMTTRGTAVPGSAQPGRNASAARGSDQVPAAKVLPDATVITRIQLARPATGGLVVRGLAVAIVSSQAWLIEGPPPEQTARRVDASAAGTALSELLALGGDGDGDGDGATVST